jgi:hypothetical protein
VSLEKLTKSLGSCASRCNIVLSGVKVLRDHVNLVCDTAATVYRMERGPWHFGWKLNSERRGVSKRRQEAEHHLCMKKARNSTNLLVRGAWPSRGLPFVKEHQRGLVGTLRGSGYLGKNTGVVHESLLSLLTL